MARANKFQFAAMIFLLICAQSSEALECSRAIAALVADQNLDLKTLRAARSKAAQMEDLNEGQKEFFGLFATALKETIQKRWKNLDLSPEELLDTASFYALNIERILHQDLLNDKFDYSKDPAESAKVFARRLPLSPAEWLPKAPGMAAMRSDDSFVKTKLEIFDRVVPWVIEAMTEKARSLEIPEEKIPDAVAKASIQASKLLKATLERRLEGRSFTIDQSLSRDRLGLSKFVTNRLNAEDFGLEFVPEKRDRDLEEYIQRDLSEICPRENLVAYVSKSLAAEMRSRFMSEGIQTSDQELYRTKYLSLRHKVLRHFREYESSLAEIPLSGRALEEVARYVISKAINLKSEGSLLKVFTVEDPETIELLAGSLEILQREYSRQGRRVEGLSIPLLGGRMLDLGYEVLLAESRLSAEHKKAVQARIALSLLSDFPRDEWASQKIQELFDSYSKLSLGKNSIQNPREELIFKQVLPLVLWNAYRMAKYDSQTAEQVDLAMRQIIRRFALDQNFGEQKGVSPLKFLVKREAELLGDRSPTVADAAERALRITDALKHHLSLLQRRYRTNYEGFEHKIDFLSPEQIVVLDRVLTGPSGLTTTIQKYSLEIAKTSKLDARTIYFDQMKYGSDLLMRALEIDSFHGVIPRSKDEIQAQVQSIKSFVLKGLKGLRADEVIPRPKEDKRTHVALWRRFQTEKSETIRNELMLAYQEHVKVIAEKYLKSLPAPVTIEQLIAAGQFGLMDAIDGYDLDRGNKFETYSAMRILGAMKDFLREIDWTTRLDRHRGGIKSDAIDSFKMEFGRAPNLEELRARLIQMNADLPPENAIDIEKVLAVDEKSEMLDSDTNRKDPDEGVTAIGLASGVSVSPEMRAAQRDLMAKLSRGFSRAEQLMIRLYYFEDMTMKEIGKVIGLSESRVSQQIAQILRTWKARYQGSEVGERLLEELMALRSQPH